MNEQITCKVCRGRFTNNPEKHPFRPKWCPCCKTPYKQGVGIHIGFSWPKIQRDWQQIFNFFPKRDKRSIFYECSNSDCKFHTDIAEEVTFEKYPDKTRETVVGGKPQTVVLSYRDIVTCPKCNSHMIRKRGKKQ